MTTITPLSVGEFGRLLGNYGEACTKECEEAPPEVYDRSSAAGEAVSAAYDAALAEIDRLAEHSTTLNTISYRMAAALGDVTDGQSIEANPEELVGRLIFEVVQLRSTR